MNVGLPIAKLKFSKTTRYLAIEVEHSRRIVDNMYKKRLRNFGQHEWPLVEQCDDRRLYNDT